MPELIEMHYGWVSKMLEAVRPAAADWVIANGHWTEGDYNAFKRDMLRVAMKTGKGLNAKIVDLILEHEYPR